MRRTLTLCRTGLAAAAAVVLLTACSGNDGTSASPSSASSSSASATTSASSAESSGSGSEFCTQAASTISQLGSVLTVQDPAQLGPALQTAATQLGAIDPPPEIAADWKALVDGISQIAQAATTTDFTDQAQAQAFQQQATQLEAQLGTSETKVQDYLTNQCGITGSTGTAAPTS
jgi:hypothetical protein